MSKPLFFSVVIPTYNREKFILKTLETVFSQTYPHYEVIVVDNCSTDKTEEVLAPLIDSGKVRFIKHEENFERARSRNTGMENARGDFLTFLDSDDFMYPSNLQDAARFAEEYPEFKFFHCLYELVNEEGEPIYHYRFPSLDDRLRAIVAGNFLSCIGTFLHKGIYSKYRFDTFPELSGGEDWEFWLRIMADHPIGRINNINGALVHHSGRSINNQSIEGMRVGLAYLVDKFQNDKHLSNVYRKYLPRIEANCFLYLNLLANDAEQNEKAFYFLRMALRKDRSVFFTTRFL
ncbi:MAG: glycosyltransferase family 2 protein, partial [Planctomycetes bacterium]|nr:glycosyltransferase family 2 protein [Planctomycetota bacterium]